MRLRVSVLVRGAPALSVAEFAKAPRRTILGTSLTVVAPTGQFFPDRLINLGVNRWAFKPEFAVSHPMGQKWLLDVYAGLWLFTANDSFYPGASLRTQAPMGAFQAHLSYNVTRKMWAAFNATYYVGGRTTIEGVGKDDGSRTLAWGGRSLSRWPTAFDQAGGEQRRHHPIRRQLHDLLRRVADGLVPRPKPAR